MELGLTFPLQRFLHQKPPPYGSEADRRFCWDLHVIELRGRKCLLAVHCHSRYTFVRFDVPGLLWADLPTLFHTGLSDSLTAAGFAPAQISAYLQAAGAVRLTRTHGRRGGSVSQSRMGGCSGAGHLPGHRQRRPAHAGLGRKRPPQPVCWL